MNTVQRLKANYKYFGEKICMRKGYIELEEFESLFALNLKRRANFTEQLGLKLMRAHTCPPTALRFRD